MRLDSNKHTAPSASSSSRSYYGGRGETDRYYDASYGLGSDGLLEHGIFRCLHNLTHFLTAIFLYSDVNAPRYAIKPADTTTLPVTLMY